MATTLKITETEEIYMSNIAVGGMYLLVADALPESERKMSVWLKDLWDRTAPFMDFDLRQLPPASRKAFWKAASSVYKSLKEKHQHTPPENAFSFSATESFIEKMNSVLGEFPDYLDTDFGRDLIDFTEIWNEENQQSSR